MKIVVLAGGTSTEREVSFSTGSQVYKALRERGHQAVLVDSLYGLPEVSNIEELFENGNGEEQFTVGTISPDIEALAAARKKNQDGFFGPNVLAICRAADIVFMALHGEDGENGKVQATFDMLGIRYTGTGYLGSALAMDKGLSKQMFLGRNVPTAQAVTLKKDEYVPGQMKMPFSACVVKPCCGGSSVGITIANSEAEYQQSLAEAFALENEVLVEQFVKGREFSIGVIEGRALPIIEIAPINGFYDYKNKYQPGMTVDTCPAILPDEITDKLQREAEHVFKVLYLDTYARIDFLLNEKNEIFCLEANTLPGMTPTSLLPQEAAAEGVSFGELCEKLVEVSLKKYQ